jgi:uncharacterized protein YbjT (DUF2867 family)
MILLTGATGMSGSEIARQLSTQGVPVRALARDAAKAKGLLPAPVEIVHGDLGRAETLGPALEGVETAFLLSLGDPRQVELQGNLIAAAMPAGTPRVIKCSAAGAGPASPMRLVRLDAETERQLEQSGLGYTHLRPTMFMQNFVRFYARSIAAEDRFYAPLGEGKVALVDVRDIAAVAVKVLTEPGHQGQTYLITGAEALTFAQAAKKLSATLGRAISYIDVPPETGEARMMAAGASKWHAGALLEVYAFFREGRAAPPTDVVKRVAGKDPITFDHFVRDHTSAFARSPSGR